MMERLRKINVTIVSAFDDILVNYGKQKTNPLVALNSDTLGSSIEQARPTTSTKARMPNHLIDPLSQDIYRLIATLQTKTDNLDQNVHSYWKAQQVIFAAIRCIRFGYECRTVHQTTEKVCHFVCRQTISHTVQ